MLVQLFAFRIEYIKKNNNTRSVWPLHRYFQRRLYAIHTYMTYYVHWSRHLKQTSFQCPFDRSIFKFIMSITITEHGATTTSHFVEVNIKILHKAYYYTPCSTRAVLFCNITECSRAYTPTDVPSKVAVIICKSIRYLTHNSERIIENRYGLGSLRFVNFCDTILHVEIMK